MKKFLCVLVALVLTAGGSFAGVGIFKKQKINRIEKTVYPVTANVEKLEREEFSNTYAFDIFDLKKFVGFVDYVFVGKVDELVGTSYRDVIYREDGRISAITYTNYKITVVKNIKGNLQTGVSIPLMKHGGVSYDNKSLVIASGEDLPHEGGYYIFSGYADENGELYVVDPNSSVFLGDSAVTLNEAGGKAESGIDEYLEAVKNQDESVRIGERYVSKYEIK